MIKGIIFDLGRTLIYFGGKHKDVKQVAIHALITFLEDNGFVIDNQFSKRFQEARELGWKQAEESSIEQNMVPALKKALGVRNRITSNQNKLLRTATRIYFDVLENYWQNYSDTLDTLKQLNRLNLRLGAISNYENEYSIKKSTERLGISSFLDPIIISEKVKWRKPAPKVFRIVSQQWGLKPSEIIMIGDSLHDDILGAQSVGIRGILLCRTNQKMGECKFHDDLGVKPFATVSSLSEAIHIVKNY